MENLLSYSGKVGQLAKIHFKNMFLTIVTLGIYRFWGKTNLRRYIWSSYALDNDPLVYHGNAHELLKGFLKALPI